MVFKFVSMIIFLTVMSGCDSYSKISDPFLYLSIAFFLSVIFLFIKNRGILRRNQEIKLELSSLKYRIKDKKSFINGFTNNSPCGMMVLNQQGVIIEANKKITELFDLPSIEALKATDAFTFLPFVQANISDSIVQVFEDDKARKFSFLYISKWGKESNLNAVFSTFRENDEPRLLAFFADMTELENLKEKLMHSHKMESLGVLAGGIVHDFNNILGAIMGYAEMTMLDISDSGNSKENISQVIMACHRAKDLVSHILSFTREEDTIKKPVNVSLIVKETLNLLRASFPSTIEISVVNELDPSSDEDLIYGNSTEIHQILMNLCTNAAHAMEGIDGKLEIRTAIEEVSEEKFKEIKPGNFVKLSISDNGHGMDPETVKKIFDPYFTTKESGHGTGMGLFVVQGIILSHGGVVKAESKSGVGSTFHIYLPAIEGRSEVIPEETDDYKGSKERILLVDDEEQLISLGKQLLERLDYEVTVSLDPVEALDMFKKTPFDFDLVITDMTMPGITGDILLKEIIQIRPELPVVICTGYSDLINEEKAKKIGASGFIMKPLGKKELGKVVQNALEMKK